MSEVRYTIVELNKQLKKLTNDIISVGEELSKLLKNYSPEISDSDFKQLKSLFKKYHENFMNIYNNTEIKQKKEILYKKMIELINNYQSYQQNADLFSQIEQIRQFENEEFYKSYDETIETFDLENELSIRNDSNYRNYNFYSFYFASENDIIYNRLKELLEGHIDETLVSKNEKLHTINAIIKSEEILRHYNGLKECNEIKKIIDGFLVETCKVDKQNIDYLGNKISFNTTLTDKRGTEKYYPPYGWFGIGLKVKGKYKGDKKDKDDNWLNDISESSKWAIAYHGVGRMSTDDEIKKILLNIMEEGLKPGQSQIKCHSMDKRHPGKKIGTGVYLTQNISIAEEYSGIIQFNNKQYKIVLMAKVLIEKIREPEDYNYWILSNNNIRVYRILLKEKI